MTVRKITNPTHYTCLSTDTKPLPSDAQGVEEGSTLLEVDRGISYIYRNDGWKPIRVLEETATRVLLSAIHKELCIIRFGMELITSTELDQEYEEIKCSE